MCGIAGFINFSASVQIGLNHLEEASRILAHRGPDDEGFLLISTQNDSIPVYSGKFEKPALQPHAQLVENIQTQPWKLGFIHRRLSIINLKPEGHQPFWDKNSGIWLNFNGEIYNYKSLKLELQSFGHRFQTETDTEVLLKSYLQWGSDCVHHLDGMWAFALVDIQKSIFFASTDRAGIKPLYWHKSQSGFCFSSEIKAFRAFNIPFYENPNSVARFLAYGKSDESSSTFFEGIYRLQAGHNLEIDLKSNSQKITAYNNWKANQAYEYEPFRKEKEWIEQLQNQLIEMIRLRIQADVPLGICLSGGIDSSTIAGLLAFADRQTNSKSTRKAFMATLPTGGPLDEFPFANQVAKELGFEMITTSPTKNEFYTSLEDLIYTLDEPPPGPNAYSQYAVFKKVKENKITVTLDGQGADELFGGYPGHWYSLVSENLKAGILRSDTLNYLPIYFQKTWRNTLPSSLENIFLFWKKPEYQMLNSIVFSMAGKKEILNKQLNDELLAEFTSTSLPFLLKAADRNSMRWSVESRMPFADFSPLVQYAFSLPGASKIQFGISKYLLRKAAKPFVNQSILDRKDKIGFSAPNREWMSAIPETTWNELLDIPNPWIKIEEVKKWVNNSDNADISLIWRVFAYLLWHKIFIQNQEKNA